ncbi:hypothetical protein DPM19_12585 [Actinomadura craniellae]|uniref:Uncharacterized protein n=1 Tax=Actinomadura craniellae TaxID=2231787 RepID=A0A365H6D9_9ACTN|nr:hypothetical protein [Actinomadura craniellae]RAY14598.1 hypothetical protein DPM19_12585 [Actinomadura craniellae]
MSIIFVGIMPDNPGGACPAVFRSAEPGGGYYFQGKIVERRQVPNGQALVWLPESMTEIIREACRVHPAVDVHADLEMTKVRRVARTNDGFHVQGVIVSDPEILAKIAADSPILADELVVWLPESATVEIVETCDA